MVAASGLGEQQYATSRKLVRVALLVGLGGNILSACAKSLALPGSADMLVVVIAVGTGLFGVIGEFAKFIYLEKLANRIPDDQLAGRARFLRWAYGLTMGAMVVFGAIIGLVMSLAGPGATTVILPLGCVAGLTGIAFFVFAIMTLFMYGRFRKAFQQQAESARQVWSRVIGQAGEPARA